MSRAIRRLPYDLVASRTTARADCKSLADIYVSDQLLHQGKSRVYPACLPGDRRDCPYVIKIREIRDRKELASFLNEQFFAEFIDQEFRAMRTHNQIYSGLSSITPKLHDAWVCPGANGYLSAFLVMDRKDGTLRQLAQTATIDFTAVADQLLRLTAFLSDSFLWHKNMSIDNVLYRRISDQVFELFLTDWADVVWDPSKKKLDRDYQSVIGKIIGQLHHVQRRDRQDERKAQATVQPFAFSSAESPWMASPEPARPMRDEHYEDDYLPPVDSSQAAKAA